MKWILFLLMIYIAMSMLTMVAYARDKSAAQKKRRRVSEHTLQLMSLAGGWPGALIAQQWLRHKTQKRPFLIMFWALVMVNLLIVCTLLYFVW